MFLSSCFCKSVFLIVCFDNVVILINGALLLSHAKNPIGILAEITRNENFTNQESSVIPVVDPHYPVEVIYGSLKETLKKHPKNTDTIIPPTGKTGLHLKSPMPLFWPAYLDNSFRRFPLMEKYDKNNQQSTETLRLWSQVNNHYFKEMKSPVVNILDFLKNSSRQEYVLNRIDAFSTPALSINISGYHTLPFPVTDVKNYILSESAENINRKYKRETADNINRHKTAETISVAEDSKDYKTMKSSVAAGKVSSFYSDSTFQPSEVITSPSVRIDFYVPIKTAPLLNIHKFKPLDFFSSTANLDLEEPLRKLPSRVYDFRYAQSSNISKNKQHKQNTASQNIFNKYKNQSGSQTVNPDQEGLVNVLRVRDVNDISSLKPTAILKDVNRPETVRDITRPKKTYQFPLFLKYVESTQRYNETQVTVTPSLLLKYDKIILLTSHRPKAMEYRERTYTTPDTNTVDDIKEQLEYWNKLIQKELQKIRTSRPNFTIESTKIPTTTYEQTVLSIPSTTERNVYQYPYEWTEAPKVYANHFNPINSQAIRSGIVQPYYYEPIPIHSSPSQRNDKFYKHKQLASSGDKLNGYQWEVQRTSTADLQNRYQLTKPFQNINTWDHRYIFIPSEQKKTRLRIANSNYEKTSSPEPTYKINLQRPSTKEIIYRLLEPLKEIKTLDYYWNEFLQFQPNNTHLTNVDQYQNKPIKAIYMKPKVMLTTENSVNRLRKIIEKHNIKPHIIKEIMKFEKHPDTTTLPSYYNEFKLVKENHIREIWKKNQEDYWNAFLLTTLAEERIHQLSKSLAKIQSPSDYWDEFLRIGVNKTLLSSVPLDQNRTPQTAIKNHIIQPQIIKRIRGLKKPAKITATTYQEERQITIIKYLNTENDYWNDFLQPEDTLLDTVNKSWKIMDTYNKNNRRHQIHQYLDASKAQNDYGDKSETQSQENLYTLPESFKQTKLQDYYWNEFLRIVPKITLTKLFTTHKNKKKTKKMFKATYSHGLNEVVNMGCTSEYGSTHPKERRTWLPKLFDNNKIERDYWNDFLQMLPKKPSLTTVKLNQKNMETQETATDIYFIEPSLKSKTRKLYWGELMEDFRNFIRLKENHVRDTRTTKTAYPKETNPYRIEGSIGTTKTHDNSFYDFLRINSAANHYKFNNPQGRLPDSIDSTKILDNYWNQFLQLKSTAFQASKTPTEQMKPQKLPVDESLYWLQEVLESTKILEDYWNEFKQLKRKKSSLNTKDQVRNTIQRTSTVYHEKEAEKTMAATKSVDYLPLSFKKSTPQYNYLNKFMENVPLKIFATNVFQSPTKFGSAETILVESDVWNEFIRARPTKSTTMSLTNGSYTKLSQSQITQKVEDNINAIPNNTSEKTKSRDVNVTKNIQFQPKAYLYELYTDFPPVLDMYQNKALQTFMSSERTKFNTSFASKITTVGSLEPIRMAVRPTNISKTSVSHVVHIRRRLSEGFTSLSPPTTAVSSTESVTNNLTNIEELFVPSRTSTLFSWTVKEGNPTWPIIQLTLPATESKVQRTKPMKPQKTFTHFPNPNFPSVFERNFSIESERPVEKENTPKSVEVKQARSKVQIDKERVQKKVKCVTCGLDKVGIPRVPTCYNIFSANDVRYTYLKRNHYTLCERSFKGGCFKRYVDIGGVYDERGCRSEKPTIGKSFASKRLAALEVMLKKVSDGCVVSPSASLTPFSRSISLWANYHACVCTGKYCNQASIRTSTVYLQYSMYLLLLQTSDSISGLS